MGKNLGTHSSYTHMWVFIKHGNDQSNYTELRSQNLSQDDHAPVNIAKFMNTWCAKCKN